MNREKFIPISKPDEVTSHKEINEDLETLDHVLFEAVMTNLQKRKASPEKIKELQDSFDEYMRVTAELLEKLGRSFSPARVREKIPNNQWLKISHSLMKGFLDEHPEKE